MGCRVAMSIRKILKLPGSNPRVQANAINLPSDRQDGLATSPSPVVSILRSVPSSVIRQSCCLPPRPEINSISEPVLGLSFGETSIARTFDSLRNPLPSTFAIQICTHPLIAVEKRICLLSGVNSGVSTTDETGL